MQNQFTSRNNINSNLSTYNRPKRKGLAAILIISIALIIAAFASGFYIGKVRGVSNGQPNLSDQNVINQDEGRPSDVDFSLFWEVWNTVNAKHVSRPFDQQQLLYGAISGMVDAVGDPFTAFMDPEETRSFTEDLDGVFEGIGAEIGIKNSQLVIIAPLENSPAEKAGLRAGDKIVKIDDQLTDGLTLVQAVQLIRGPRGTDVTLTIIRDGNLKDALEVTITRDVIELKSVNTELLQDDIVLVEITRFGEDTTAEFSQAIDFIKANNARGVILDLRNNPGGFLEVSIDVTSEFLKSGTVVTEDFVDQEDTVYEATGDPRLPDIPTVVLVNEGSASASEIVAGALRDNKRATLIGKQTFGKGSVQELLSLIDGSSLRITIAKWITPAGENINEQGLIPDIEIELTEDDFNNDRDPQLDKAVEYMKDLIK